MKKHKDLLKVRPLKDGQFCARSRKTKILTTGIHAVFRGLKFEIDAELVQKGAFFKGLKGRSGFTLLEVLVALIIIGVALGTAFQAFSQSKRIAWKADEKTEGARIAQNIFANTVLIDTAVREEYKEGEVPGEKGWRYKLSVRPLSLQSEEGERPIEIPSMLNLSLLLVYDTGQRQKSFHLDRWYRR